MTRPQPPSSRATRRDFIKSSAVLASAAAFPTIVPARVLGEDAPSGRINLGFIGIGKQSSGHLNRFLGSPGTQVVAVCDVDTTRREHARKTVEQKYAKLERAGFKGCKEYTRYQDLLARKDIDAVVIGTPDHWHATIAIEACKAGMDIYCEKPMSLTIHEAQQMIAAVRKHDRVFQTGSQQRSEHRGRFRVAAEYVRNGRLGKIQEVHVGIGTTSKWCDLPAQTPHDGLDWDQWLGQAPKRPYNEVLCRNGLPNTYPFNPGWRDYREYSGGMVTDWGAHHFDITQWALGKDESGPVEILPPAGEDDLYNARVIYTDGPNGEDRIVATHKKMQNGIRFIGTEGEIFVNRGKLESKPESILMEPLTDEDTRLFESPGHHKNWLDCIASRQRPICDVEIGGRSVTVCHLVNLAYWHRRPLKWDPKKWEFPGDAEANGWKEREKRDPYDLPAV